jgi:hypothetical protein
MSEPSTAPQLPERDPLDPQHLLEKAPPFDIDAWFAYRSEHPIPPEEWEAYLRALESLREAVP